MSPSIWQILIVVGIFVVLFMGPSRIPGLGKSLGEAIRGFKKGLDDDEIDVTESAKQVDGGGDKASDSEATQQQKTEKQKS